VSTNRNSPRSSACSRRGQRAMRPHPIAQRPSTTRKGPDSIRRWCASTVLRNFFEKNPEHLLTVFAVILHNTVRSAMKRCHAPCQKRCLARLDAKRNVDCSLQQSTRGNGRVTVRVLVARSHHNGEEEEEGCQEGRQEEEGPRLNRWLIEFFRELFQPGETSFRQPVPVPFSAFRRERPARALGRPGRPDFLNVRLRHAAHVI
jgi:hypothetical protein